MLAKGYVRDQWGGRTLFGGGRVEKEGRWLGFGAQILMRMAHGKYLFGF